MKTKLKKSETQITSATIFIQYPWENGIAGDSIEIKPLKKAQSGVYQLRNKLNGRIYIGMARNLEVRMKRHWNDLRTQKHCSPKMQSDYENFIFSDASSVLPEDLFEFEVIIYCYPSQLTFWEGILIGNLNPYYNVHKKGKKKLEFFIPEEADNFALMESDLIDEV